MRIAEVLHSNALPPAEREILLSHAIGKERTWILAHPEYELSAAEIERWQSCASRRAACEPMSYILGTREFFGREFLVSPDVLIPRPSTEGLILAAQRWLQSPYEGVQTVDSNIVVIVKTLKPLSVRTVADVGTGSGCIAVTLACEDPRLRIIATDISEPALEIARRNAERHRVGDRITFIRGKNLEPMRTIRESYLLVSNPPYIPSRRALETEVAAFEPHAALFGGADGTSVLRCLLREAGEDPLCAGVVLECETQQAKLFEAL